MAANRFVLKGVLAGMVVSAFAPIVLAKDKSVLPAWILTARTVAVVIDPDEGVALDDPNANPTAQKDVEAALLAWGRYTTVIGPEQADLVIVVHKGSGKLVQETMSDPRQNGRVGSVNTAPGSVGVGAQHGQQPGLSSGRPPDGSDDGVGGAHSQVEMGRMDDSFEVYKGDTEHPMDAPAAWHYTRKDALHSHDVPAVAEFRKAVAEAEKQAAKKHP